MLTLLREKTIPPAGTLKAPPTRPSKNIRGPSTGLKGALASKGLQGASSRDRSPSYDNHYVRVVMLVSSTCGSPPPRELRIAYG